MLFGSRRATIYQLKIVQRSTLTGLSAGFLLAIFVRGGVTATDKIRGEDVLPAFFHLDPLLPV